MTPDSIQTGLKSRLVGTTVHVHESATSTNDLAWIEVGRGAPDGLVIVAAEQTRGRGRFGRTWHSPRGGLWASVILRPSPVPQEPILITCVAALGMREAVEALGVAGPKIRFPNDVVVRDRKICGVLAECRLIGNQPDVFVIGLGLNVNNDLPGDLPDATTLKAELGRETPVAQAARTVLEGIDRWYDALRTGPRQVIAEAWREHSSVLGRDVIITIGAHSLRGLLEDMDPGGGLILRLPEGGVRRIQPEFVNELKLA